MTRAVEWLRAGYPSGVSRQDYVALLGARARAAHFIDPLWERFRKED